MKSTLTAKYKSLMVKSNYIIEASYKLSLYQLRLIYLLTTKIDKDDTEFKPYRFMPDEIGLIFGKHRFSYKEVEVCVDGLRNQDLVIIKEKSILEAKWLSSAEYFDDGSVELCFDNKLKPYLLQLKDKFTKLNFNYFLVFNSIYACRFYELLKQYLALGERIIDIEDLRIMLRAEDVYKLFSDFKRYVIEAAKKEVNNKSDIRFNYVPIKTGKKVTKLKLSIESQEPPLDENKELIKSIRAIVSKDLTAIDCVRINSAAGGDLNLISKKYKAVCKYAKNNTVINLAATLIDAIKNWKDPKDIKTPSTFNNFKGREYTGEQLNYFVDKLTAYQDQEVLKQADCITCVLFQKDKCMLKKQPDKNGMCSNYNERIVKND